MILKDEQLHIFTARWQHERGKQKGAFYLLTDAIIRDHAGTNKIFRFEGSDIPGISFFDNLFGPERISYQHLVMNKLPFFSVFQMNSMIKKQYYIFYFYPGFRCTEFAELPTSELFFDDKEIFKYVGLVIYKGGVPYRDVFDHKPPLIYFLNAFNWWFNVWIPWLLDTCLVLFATLLFYWLCRKNKLAGHGSCPLVLIC